MFILFINRSFRVYHFILLLSFSLLLVVVILILSLSLSLSLLLLLFLLLSSASLWLWLLLFFLARWLTSARAYRIGGRKLCPSVCLYVKRYLLLQFCTDYNQTWINMIWAVAAKTLLSQIFHNWRRIEVNCVYISHCKWYRTSAGMPACIPNRRCCAGQCAGQ